MKKWIKTGLVWGGLMFLWTIFSAPLFGNPITLKNVLIAAPLWTISGLLYGYALHYVLDKFKKKDIA